LHLARVAALCSKLRMSIATLRDENDRLKALLTQTQATLSEHQAALAASEEARRRLEVIVGELRREKFGCQSAPKFDPVSASKFDPFDRRGLAVALGPSELAGIAETERARVV
jgi:hypothetical protein